MKKLIVFVALIGLLIFWPQSSSGQGSLKALLENINDGTVLNIIDLESEKVFRKVTVTNGKFDVGFNLSEPKFFGIWGENPKYPKDRLFIWLENSEIQLSGNFDYFINAKVTGSVSNKIYQQFVALEKSFESRLTRLLASKDTTDNLSIKNRISAEVELVQKQFRNEKINLYSSQAKSKVAFYQLFNETTSSYSVLTKSDIKVLYHEIPEKFKQSRNGELLNEFISLPEVPETGEKFIDCAQLTPGGKHESISGNLGKYTLLEFWSSGCGPCRAEHPRVRKMYDLYHDKGLNIISISGDNNIDAWKSAIKKDSMTWLNISDLKGWHNEAFIVYGVKYIPRMILLDKNGIIVDNQFGLKDWQNEIEKLFK